MSTADWPRVYREDKRGPKFRRYVETAEQRTAAVFELEENRRRKRAKEMAMKRIASALLLLILALPALAQVVITNPQGKLIWTYADPTHVDGFYVYTSSNLIYPTTPYKTVAGGASTSVVVDRPDFGVWNFIVRAFKGLNLSAPSNTAAADFQMTVPGSLSISASIASLGKFDATIRWATAEPADGTVLFGEGDSLNRLAALDGLVLEHSIRLGGLKNHRLYSFRAVSRTADGLVLRSDVGTFVTS